MSKRPGASDRHAVRRRLRREAAASRPAFSPTLQARIEAALPAGRAARRRVPSAAGLTTLVGGVAAGCLAVAVWLAAGWDSPPRPDGVVRVATVAGVAEIPAIDQLPLWDELGEEVIAGTAALAAEAVGLPRWNDLVDAGAAVVGPGDDRASPITP